MRAGRARIKSETRLNAVWGLEHHRKQPKQCDGCNSASRILACEHKLALANEPLMLTLQRHQHVQGACRALNCLSTEEWTRVGGNGHDASDGMHHVEAGGVKVRGCNTTIVWQIVHLTWAHPKAEVGRPMCMSLRTVCRAAHAAPSQGSSPSSCC